MEHYFTKQTSQASKPYTFTTTLQNKHFQYWTDLGVFSKNGLDIGTRALLEVVLKSAKLQNIENEKNCLDLGCGYGPICISLKAFYPMLKFTAIDINERACFLAEKNVQLYQQNTDVYNVEALPYLLSKKNTYDFIFSNPPVRIGKEAMYTMLKTAWMALKPKGELILVIGKKQGADSLEKFFLHLGAQVETIGKQSNFKVFSIHAYTTNNKC